MKTDFWTVLDQLIARSVIVIDRKQGSRHPRYPELVYPVDYGYLQDTMAMDGEGIDIWVGTHRGRGADAVLCTVDLLQRDAEIKILFDCTEGEKAQIQRVQNQSAGMKALLIRRE